MNLFGIEFGSPLLRAWNEAIEEDRERSDPRVRRRGVSTLRGWRQPKRGRWRLDVPRLSLPAALTCGAIIAAGVALLLGWFPAAIEQLGRFGLPAALGLPLLGITRYSWSDVDQLEDSIASGRASAEIAKRIPGLDSFAMSARRDAAIAELLAQAPEFFSIKSFPGYVGDGVNNDLSAMQAAADAAELAGGGVVYGGPGTYVIGPANGATPLVAGDYSLKLGNGVTLWLDPAATVIRRFAGGGAVNATLRNKDLAGGNSNIGIIGGVFTATNSANTGKHIAPTRVTGFRWSGSRITGVFDDWNTALNVSNARISDIEIVSGDGISEDGLHIVGGSKIVVTNLIADCGDDCISLWPDQDGNQGDIRHVTINGAACRTARANVIRVGTPAAATEVVEDVRIANVTGIAGIGGNGNGIRVIDTPAAGRVREINLSHITLDCSANGGACADIDDAVHLKLLDVEFITPSSRIEVDGGSDITLDTVKVRGLRGVSVQCVLVAASKAVARFHIFRGEYESATTHGIELGTAGFALTDFEIIGATIRSCTNNGLRIRNASGGRVLGNKSTANGGIGIEEIAPSDNNIIFGNDTRANGGGATVYVGANTECGRNLGAASSQLGRTANGLIVLTDGASIATDASRGNTFKVTLAGTPRNMAAPSNPSPGQRITYEVVQDGTGGRTLGWNAVFVQKWSDVGNVAGATSTISFVYDSGAVLWVQDGAQEFYQGAAPLDAAGDVVATGGFRQTPDGWYQDNVAASQTDVELVRATGRFRAARAGSVTGVVVHATEARTVGTLTIKVFKNTGLAGAAGAQLGTLTAVLDGTNTSKKATTQAKDLDTFAAGDELYLTITTDGTWAPTTSDIRAALEIED